MRPSVVGRVDRAASVGRAILVVSVLCIVHLVWPDGWFGQTTYMTVTIGASVVAWLSVHRFGGSPRVWLAAAVTASALGDLLYQLSALVGAADPDISIADLAWVASYVGVSIAILQLLRRSYGHSRHDIDAMIDAAVIVIVAVLLVWQFWLDPGIGDASVAWPVRAVWASYPVLDAMLLALVVRSLVARRTQSAMGLLVAAGVACWLVSDFAFLIFMPEGSVGVLLDVGWMVGAALLAVGCWRIPDLDGADLDLDQPQVQIGPFRIALALTPLIVPGGIELVSHVQGWDPNPVPLLAASVAFTVLYGIRAVRLLRLRDRAQVRLARSERRYRALAANSSDAVLVLDAEGRITNDAPNLLALLGLGSGQTRGHRALDFVSTSDVTSRQLFADVLRTPGLVHSGETRVSRGDGADLWLSTRAVNLLDDPDVDGIVVNVHDISARKRAEEALAYQTFHDALTGLANRALFRDRVEHALDRRARTGLDPAESYLDHDGFKHVNDGLGHEAGDVILCEVAARLLEIVRTGDTVARLGGDEFAVLIEEPFGALAEAEAIAERVLRSLTVPVTVEGHVVSLSASLGIAMGHLESSASSLLRDADVAMYEAKTTGRSRWVV
ncbi:MAG: sensor domain-containing diguanylate cyclase, partial [Ilumatobacteraceae bacterium]